MVVSCRITKCNVVVGGYYDSSVKRLKAKIDFQKKKYYLGSSTDIDDVIKLRKDAEQHLHKGFLDWYRQEYQSNKIET